MLKSIDPRCLKNVLGGAKVHITQNFTTQSQIIALEPDSHGRSQGYITINDEKFQFFHSGKSLSLTGALNFSYIIIPYTSTLPKDFVWQWETVNDGKAVKISYII